MALEPLTALRALYRPSDPGFRADLTAAQRAVLAVLVMHADDAGSCWPAVGTLARASGYSRAMVLRVLGELEEVRAVSRQPRPPRPTLYTVHRLDRPGSGPSREETETVHHVDGDSPPRGPELPIELPIELLTIFGDGSPAVRRQVTKGGGFPALARLPRNGRGRIYPPEFEGAFAALPPRHVPHPKADAYTAWRARTREVLELFQLEAAALSYREDVERQGRTGTEYVLQASTFFGAGERWQPYLGREPGSLSAGAPGSNGYRPAMTAAEEEGREQARREAARARSARAETQAQLAKADEHRRELAAAKAWLDDQDEDTVARINRELAARLRAAPQSLRGHAFAEGALIALVRAERSTLGVGA